MTNNYQRELDQLPISYEEALVADYAALKDALKNAASKGMIAVGSGGSFTTAYFLADLNERITGRLARALTPLELISNPEIAEDKAVFLISAEGKNTDIIEALNVLQEANSLSMDIITNSVESKLAERACSMSDVGIHVFQFSSGKDGYLATNSLFATVTLLTNAYSSIASGFSEKLPSKLGEMVIGSNPIDAWVNETLPQLTRILSKNTLIIIFDPEIKAAAIDLESKLIESGLLNVQIADIRSFAHGRHFWLARHGETTGVLGMYGVRCQYLWESLYKFLPMNHEIAEIYVQGAYPINALSAVAVVLNIIRLAGDIQGVDPGKPGVPQFGRDIYHTSIADVVRPGFRGDRKPEQLKQRSLGVRMTTSGAPQALTDGLMGIYERLSRKEYRAAVFDYDGTLCRTRQRYEAPDSNVVNNLIRLAEAGVTVGLASGRGESLYQHFQICIPKKLYSKFVLGLHNGGNIIELQETYKQPAENNDPVLAEALDVVKNLKNIGAPIEKYTARPHQISVACEQGANVEELWLVIFSELRRKGVNSCKVVRSAHSVDVLGESVSKMNVLRFIENKLNIDSEQILSFGDQGAWPGNDCELLETVDSLSVDVPSRSLESGWRLSPSKLRSVDAMLWYFSTMKLTEKGKFRMDFNRMAIRE